LVRAAVTAAPPLFELLAVTEGAGTAKIAGPAAPVAVSPCACATLTWVANTAAAADRLWLAASAAL
jgi:hypothetical protein